MVAEGVPMHTQTCIRPFQLEIFRNALSFAILHQQECDSQMMQETFFVWYLKEHCLVGKMQQSIINKAIFTIHDAVYPCLRQGRTHLETGRMLSRDGVAR